MIDIAAAVKLANEVLYAQTMSRHRYDEVDAQKARAVAATVIAMAAALREIGDISYAASEYGEDPLSVTRDFLANYNLTDSGAETQRNEAGGGA